VDCLSRSFYAQPTEEVAKKLIGKKLVRVLEKRSPPNILSGIIVETEAYGSTNDEASHAYNGPTERNSIMFGEIGRVYVYLSYGNHFCFNVTARSIDRHAGAVLIRAIQPLEGLFTMMRFRKTVDPYLVASGPGRLTQALNINLTSNGLDVTRSKILLIKNGISPPVILGSSRVGVSRGMNKQWRYVFAYWDGIKNLPYASRYASKWRGTFAVASIKT
jgi:DNA-3-methyladenine glycosylase